MRANIEQMEQVPFDGLVFHITSDNGGNFTWQMWGNRKFTISDFRQASMTLRPRVSIASPSGSCGST